MRETLLLSRADVAAALGLDECIAAVESAFVLHGEGKLPPPGILGVPAVDGGFHVKAALVPGSFFAAKVNGNFSHNPERFGMPAIQGVIVLCDAANGFPLAVMDSIEITILRTGAATAIAAKHLARKGSRIATICGCGNQGRVQLRALERVLPLERVFAHDRDPLRARQLAADLSEELSIEISPVTDLGEAVRRSDVCVTCTPSRTPFLQLEWLRAGTFVAAVGADSPEKQELDCAILAASKLVVDVLEQCATIGELHHAIERGVLRRESVHAELGEVAAGARPGRTSDDEIAVFDSTGCALQDVAAAAAAYGNAVRLGRGQQVTLAG